MQPVSNQNCDCADFDQVRQGPPALYPRSAPVSISTRFEHTCARSLVLSGVSFSV
jgi:hypothetical protein